MSIQLVAMHAQSETAFSLNLQAYNCASADSRSHIQITFTNEKCPSAPLVTP